MTDPSYTALLLVIDRSGSMSSIRDDMVGGIRQLLDDQIAEPGRLTVDIVQFDDEIEHVARLADPSGLVVSLEPRGSTALLDAIGIGIEEFGRELAALAEHARPGNVQVVVVTDGFENASRRYSQADIRRLIEQQRTQYAWVFTFIGANQDAVLTAAELGVEHDAALTFAPTSAGVAASRAATSRRMAASRRGESAAFTQADRDAAGDVPGHS